MISVDSGTYPLPRIPIEEDSKIIHHVICEGSREHVLAWMRGGPTCSEPNCEINHDGYGPSLLPSTNKENWKFIIRDVQ